MLRAAPRGRYSGPPAVRCAAPRAAPRRYNAQLARECTIDRLSGNDTGIALLKLNRPAAKNAIGKVLIGQFQESLQEIQGDKSIRVVVLRSEVPGVFCAGADLKERASMSQAEVSTFVTMLRSTFSSLSQLPVPTIAAINGAALGGGLELALCCDMRIAGMDAKLGLPETKLAIIPGAGGSQRLPRLIGESKAKELIFTARALNPQEALSYGIVNYAVTGDASDKAIELAREILPQGPVALQAAKKSIDLGSGKDITTAMEIEKLCYAMVIPTKDRLEGLAAFREKRKPKYIGE